MEPTRVTAPIRRTVTFAEEVYNQISAPDDGSLPIPAPVRGVARWTLVLYRELDRHQAFSKASALAYGSLVALVPLLVLVFAVLQAVGLLALDGGALERLVFETFLGDIPMVRQILLPGLSNANFGVIGAMGTVGWLWISFRIYMTVEATFSEIFGTKVTRSLGRRIVTFYLLLTAGPVAFSLVLFGSIQMAQAAGIPYWDRTLGVLVPIVLLTGFIKAVPSTTVRWGPAIAGGIVSGLLIQVGGFAFAMYLKLFGSTDPLRTLYGSLGIVPVFLFWLWLLWLFVLLGAEVAHVAQNYRSLVRAELEQRRSRAEKVRVPTVETAIEVAAAAAWYFKRGRTPINGTALAERCRIPAARIGVVLEVLEKADVLVRTKDDGWTLARAPEVIKVRDVVDPWRQATSLRRVGGDALSEQLGASLQALLDLPLSEAAERWIEPEDGGPASREGKTSSNVGSPE